MSDRGSSQLSIRLLGPFHVLQGGEPLPRLPIRKGHWLLALLLLRHPRPVQRAWLAATLWPDLPEPQALACLRSSLTQLRIALGPDAGRLRSPTPHTLALDLVGATVDLLTFDEAIAAGDLRSLERAVALYQGPLLEGCAEEWVLEARQLREQAYLGALERLATAAQGAGDREAATRYLRQAAAADPLQESTQRALMQSLADQGSYAAALSVYRELRERLHQELNTAPDPETTALFQSIRSQARTRAQAAPAQPAVPLPARGSSGVARPLLPEGTVTFLLTDIEGSTRLWEEHPQSIEAALARHDALAAAILPQHEGSLVKQRGEGDSLFAVFAQARDAVSAALALQQAFQTEPWPAETPLRVRMALHTGDATVREGDYLGIPVNRCARLRAAGHGGQVLLSQATQELVRDTLPERASLRDLGAHRLRDLQRPEPIFQLVHPELPADFPPPRSLEAFAHNLPAQLTSFVGREREVAQVKQFLATTRLLTLTGSGGCGKTRLALQVAADLLEAYPQGVWLVELAPLGDPALVPQRVASTLGVREEPGRPLTETLLDYLRAKVLLLVLDNCEHLVAACAQLADHLLRACPQLRILASSRAGLGIAGERTYRVPSLSLPEPGYLPPVERLMEYEAVRLFVERAVFTQPCFAVTEQSAPAVAQICSRLDGIPLAIELAAARVKALPVEKLNERLDDMFRLLTGGSRTALPRQQTLRATIDWSYDLLSPSEQALLGRLSVFAGGWTLEAAEAVGAGEGVEAWEVLNLLTSLVEKSLFLYEEREGEGRYRLLETVRQYAWDRLLEAGNAAAARDRHRDWFVVLAERAKPHLQQGAEQRAWMERLARERDNLRAALAWCLEAVESDQERMAGPAEAGPEADLMLLGPTTLPTPSSAAVEAGLRLVGALTWFWIKRGHVTEEWQRVVSLLAAGHRAPAAVRGKALVCAMMIARYEDDWPTAAALAAEGLALGREGGDNWLAAASLLNTGVVAQVRGDLERAQALGEEGLALARATGDGWIVSVSLARLAEVAEARGDDAVARVLHQEVLDRFRQAEDTGGIAGHLGNLAGLARREGNYEQARALLEEATALTQEGGERKHHLYLLMCLADLVLIEGDYEPAKARYQEALAIAQELGDTHWTADALVGLARAAQALGDHDQARALLEEAHPVGQGTEACMGEGHLLLDLGDYAAARSCYEEGLALRRTGEQTRLIAYALLEVGHAAWLQGEPGVTQSHAVEALGLFQTVGDRAGILAALENLAVAALAQRRKESAARLLGAVAVLCEAPGLTWPEWRRRPRERIGEAVRAASLEQEFAAAWTAGRAMSLEDAVAFALEPGAVPALHRAGAAGSGSRPMVSE